MEKPKILLVEDNDRIGMPLLSDSYDPFYIMSSQHCSPYRPPVIPANTVWYSNRGVHVRIIEEYNLIQQKKSTLSRSHRDAIVKRYQELYD